MNNLLQSADQKQLNKFTYRARADQRAARGKKQDVTLSLVSRHPIDVNKLGSTFNPSKQNASAAASFEGQSSIQEAKESIFFNRFENILNRHQPRQFVKTPINAGESGDELYQPNHYQRAAVAEQPRKGGGEVRANSSQVLPNASAQPSGRTQNLDEYAALRSQLISREALKQTHTPPMFHYVSMIKKNKYNIQPVNCSVNMKLFEKPRASAHPEMVTGLDTSLYSSEHFGVRAAQSRLETEASPTKLSKKSKRYFAMSMNSITDRSQTLASMNASRRIRKSKGDSGSAYMQVHAPDNLRLSEQLTKELESHVLSTSDARDAQQRGHGRNHSENISLDTSKKKNVRFWSEQDQEAADDSALTAIGSVRERRQSILQKKLMDMQIDIAAAKNLEKKKQDRMQRQVDSLFAQEGLKVNETKKCLAKQELGADMKAEATKKSEDMAWYSRYVAKNTKGLIKSNFTAKGAKSTMKIKPPTDPLPIGAHIQSEKKMPVQGIEEEVTQRTTKKDTSTDQAEQEKEERPPSPRLPPEVLMQLGFRKGEERIAQNRARRQRMQASSMSMKKGSLFEVSKNSTNEKQPANDQESREGTREQVFKKAGKHNNPAKLVAISRAAASQDFAFLKANSQFSEDIHIQKIEDRIKAFEEKSGLGQFDRERASPSEVEWTSVNAQDVDLAKLPVDPAAKTVFNLQLFMQQPAVQVQNDQDDDTQNVGEDGPDGVGSGKNKQSMHSNDNNVVRKERTSVPFIGSPPKQSGSSLNIGAKTSTGPTSTIKLEQVQEQIPRKGLPDYNSSKGLREPKPFDIHDLFKNRDISQDLEVDGAADQESPTFASRRSKPRSKATPVMPRHLPAKPAATLFKQKPMSRTKRPSPKNTHLLNSSFEQQPSQNLRAKSQLGVGMGKGVDKTTEVEDEGQLLNIKFSDDVNQSRRLSSDSKHKKNKKKHKPQSSVDVLTRIKKLQDKIKVVSLEEAAAQREQELAGEEGVDAPRAALAKKRVISRSPKIKAEKKRSAQKVKEEKERDETHSARAASVAKPYQKRMPTCYHSSSDDEEYASVPMISGEKANLLSSYTVEANSRLLVQAQIFQELHLDEEDFDGILESMKSGKKDREARRAQQKQMQQQREMKKNAQIDTQAKLRSLKRLSNFVAFCAGRLVIARGKSQHAHCQLLKAVTFDDIIDARINFEETGRRTQLANVIELSNAIPKFFKVAVKGQSGPLTFQCKVSQGQGGGAVASDLVIYLSTSTSDPSATDNEMKFVSTNRSRFSFKFTPEDFASDHSAGKSGQLAPTAKAMASKDKQDGKATAQQAFVFREDFVFMYLGSLSDYNVEMRVVYGRDSNTGAPRPKKIVVPEFGLKGLKGGIAGLRRSVVSPPGDDLGMSREFERMLKLQETLKVKMSKEAEIQIVELREYYHNYKKSVKEESNHDALRENICNAADLLYRQKCREEWLRSEEIKHRKAKQRIKWLEKDRRHVLAQRANYWDEYRELRLRLIAEYIVVLKAKKRVRDYATMVALAKAVTTQLSNFQRSVIERKRAYRSIFYTIRMFCGYKYRTQRRYGRTLEFRLNNQSRQAFTVAAGALLKDKHENEGAVVLKHFLTDVAPHVQFKSKVLRLLQGVELIERTRKDILFTRILRKKFFLRQFQRELTFLREFFSKRKNPAGRAIHKALKRTLEKDVKDAVDLYQHKHYLQYLLQRKRSDLRRLKLRLEINQALLADREWELQQAGDDASPYTREDSESLAELKLRVEKDRSSLAEVQDREKDLAVELYQTERKLFSFEATDLVCKLKTPQTSLAKYQERLNVHVKTKEERIRNLISEAFKRVFVRPVGYKSSDEQQEVHMRLFLDQLKNKNEQEEEEPELAKPQDGADGEESEHISEEYEDEMSGPMVLRPSREDIHSIIVRACKLEDLGNVNLKKA